MATSFLKKVKSMDKTFIFKALEKLYLWNGYEVIQKIIFKFPNNNFFLMGGVVRDSILRSKYPINDFDIIIECNNRENILNHFIQNGYISYGQFGAPRWKPAKQDKLYCDLIFTTHFYTGLTKCHSVIDVLHQTDFTGNAVAINIRNGNTFDPVDGIKDLTNKTLRATRTNYPDVPIRPNSNLTIPMVHWFRYQYYASALGLNIEHETDRWISKNNHFIESEECYLKEFSNFYGTKLYNKANSADAKSSAAD